MKDFVLNSIWFFLKCWICVIIMDCCNYYVTIPVLEGLKKAQQQISETHL